MTVGSTIKDLRRKADLTQERLAELLNISASAVSQWETDRVMPDVTQIPLLANIFGVSADVILGIDIGKNDEKIKEILDAAHKVRTENGGLERRTEILREGLRRFPGSHKLMERLADSLVCEYSRKGMKDYSEVFGLCSRILGECTDSVIRGNALQTLGTAYGYAGMKDEMLRTAEQMPPLRFSREVFLSDNCCGMEGADSLAMRQEFLSELILYLEEALSLLSGHRNDDGGFVYSEEDRITLWKQKIALIEILFPDGDYQFIAQEAEQACYFLMGTYLRSGDAENAVYWLGKCADLVIRFDTYGAGEKHTSPALRGYSDGGWLMERGQGHSAELLDYLLSDPAADLIRGDPRVGEMMLRLRETEVKP